MQLKTEKIAVIINLNFGSLGEINEIDKLIKQNKRIFKPTKDKGEKNRKEGK